MKCNFMVREASFANYGKFDHYSSSPYRFGTCMIASVRSEVYPCETCECVCKSTVAPLCKGEEVASSARPEIPKTSSHSSLLVPHLLREELF